MTNAVSPCISDQLLRDFNAGKIQDDLREQQIAAHLATCRICEARLSTFDRDSILQLLAEPRVTAPPPHSLAHRPEESLASTKSFGEAESVNAEKHGESLKAQASNELPITIDRYFIVRELGTGGFGKVYLAQDPQHDRRVAIKVARPDRLTSEETQQAFLREARLVAGLNHPHIVPLYDCQKLADGRIIVVMKYIEGRTLQEIIKSERLPAKQCARLVADVADALDYAHRRGVWHRDVKPANILLDRDGHAYLSDFGLAIHEQHQHLHEREIAGTYPFMSPEQIGGDYLDGRTDIWSLGVVLYELLTRQRPFRGRVLGQLAEAIQHRPHSPITSHDSSIPPQLESICDRCLKKKPEERYPTPGRLAADLRTFLIRPRKIAIGSVSGFLFITFLVVLVTLVSSRGKHATPSTTPADNVQVDTRRDVGRFANAKVIVWAPKNDQVDTIGFNEKTQRYEFETRAETLIQVGECTRDAINIRTRFQMRGENAFGTAGVFWGFAPVRGENQIDACCWIIRIGRSAKGSGSSVEIEQKNIGPSGGRHAVFYTRPVQTFHIKDELEATNELEARITETAIHQLILNGRDVLEAPLPLEAAFGRPWRQLRNTGYGVFGQYGAFSFESFSVE